MNDLHHKSLKIQFSSSISIQNTEKCPITGQTPVIEKISFLSLREYKVGIKRWKQHNFKYKHPGESVYQN